MRGEQGRSNARSRIALPNSDRDALHVGERIEVPA